MSFVRSLETSPFTPGDAVDRDESQRERQIHIIAGYAVTYWVDVPARTVMVVDVRRFDG